MFDYRTITQPTREWFSLMVSERDTVLHSWCVPAQWQAPTIVGGRGAHFWDADGHDYLDMSSLSECSNLGHQHPTVVKAIREQAERLCFVTSAWGTQPRAELAQALLEKAGFEQWSGIFYVGWRRRERACCEVRSASARSSQGLDHHTRSFLSRRELCLHGVLRRHPHASSS